MENNTPIPDAALAELDRLHAAATKGEWFVQNGHRDRQQCCAALLDGNSRVICDTLNAEDVMIFEEPDEDSVYYTEGHRVADLDCAAALVNAYPALRQRLADAEAYRDEVEAAKPTVQALLDSGERAASEAADLRQRLAEAERERDERTTMAARAQEAMRHLMNGLPTDDAVWAAYGNADSARAWLAARDDQQRREGAVLTLLDMSLSGLAWDETSLRREAVAMLIDAGEYSRYESMLQEAQRLRERQG